MYLHILYGWNIRLPKIWMFDVIFSNSTKKKTTELTKKPLKQKTTLQLLTYKFHVWNKGKLIFITEPFYLWFSYAKVEEYSSVFLLLQKNFTSSNLRFKSYYRSSFSSNNLISNHDISSEVNNTNDFSYCLFVDKPRSTT